MQKADSVLKYIDIIGLQCESLILQCDELIKLGESVNGSQKEGAKVIVTS